MALLVEDKVKESRQQTTEAALMVGEQVKVKHQVLKIVQIVMVMVEALDSPLLGRNTQVGEQSTSCGKGR